MDPQLKSKLVDAQELVRASVLVGVLSDGSGVYAPKMILTRRFREMLGVNVSGQQCSPRINERC